MAYDVLIKNGLIVDGTGAEPYKGNVAISGGLLADLGDVDGPANKVIDADGSAVAPGFWDLHTHYDAQLLWDPIATSSSWHGVTSVVMGNCGFSMAPVKPQDQDFMIRMLARVEGMDDDVINKTLPWRWESFSSFMDLLEPNLGINVASLAGHNAIRRYVMGDNASQRAATDDEVLRMKAELRACLRAGAIGFSTGRVVTHADGEGNPVPSRVAEIEECIALAEVLGETGVGYTQLAVGGDFNKFTDQGRARLKELAQRSHRPVCINAVFQTAHDRTSWKETLDWMDRIRTNDGCHIFGLGYTMPGHFEFNLHSTNVFDRYPLWQKLLMATTEEKLQVLANPNTRAELRYDMEHLEDSFFKNSPITWDQIMVSKAATETYARFNGNTLVDVALHLGRDPMDAMLDIAIEEKLETQFQMRNIRNPDLSAQKTILRWPHIVPEQSDAGAHVITEVNTGFPTHMLSHWVRETGFMSIQEAVQRLSSLPAQEVGVTDRGTLQQGKAADVVIFDPDNVATSDRIFADDFPGGARRLVQYAEGIEYTIVNGKVTLDHGEYSGVTNGQLIRNNKADN